VHDAVSFQNVLYFLPKFAALVGRNLFWDCESCNDFFQDEPCNGGWFLVRDGSSFNPAGQSFNGDDNEPSFSFGFWKTAHKIDGPGTAYPGFHLHGFKFGAGRSEFCGGDAAVIAVLTSADAICAKVAPPIVLLSYQLLEFGGAHVVRPFMSPL
jgi:hypothetical protein